MERNSHLISDELRGKLPYKLLKEITNNFSEERKVGSGAFGEVYEGVLEDGRVIALKMLRYMPEVDDEQFDNECEQLRRVKHENLVQLVGFCNEKEEVRVSYGGKMICAANIHRALCLEFVPGGNLSRFLSEQYLGLNWQVRFKIIKGICEGLQYLHEVAIMHFDLKPDNILLDEKMVPKIADFGLSDLLSHENTKIAMTIGTRAYSPPEFLTEQILSNEYDIFSLGVIIKRIVTGVMDDLSIADMDDRECIEHVHNKWRKKLQEMRNYPSLETDCKQVKTCIEIAIDCMQTEQSKRPLIKNIVRMLHEVEITEHNLLSRRNEGIHDAKIRKMTYQELERITKNFSSQLRVGGFGAVYKGLSENGEERAVKRLDRLFPRKSEDHFMELVNLTGLEHRNIVQLKGYCYERNKVPVPDYKNPGKYIWQDVTESLLCYEHYPKGNLEQLLEGKYCLLDWRSIHTIIRGICEGLHYLHEGCQNAPIVHEGFKPANILLDASMVPKLGDIRTSIIDASRAYGAPEFIHTGKNTLKSNIYSLGVLILKIATRQNWRNDESSSRSYIQDVMRTRMQDSYVSSKYPSLEVGFIQQVKSWISIGLKCVEILPERRPTIGQIVHFLETESGNPEFYHQGEFSLSSESSITLWPSPEMDEHATELAALETMLSDTSVDPIRLSYALIKSITRNFSQEIGHGGFGVVYLGFLPNEKVAVKKLSIQGFSDDLFLDEIKFLKKAKHNNVARFLGYCADSHGELLEFNGKNVIAEVPQRLLCFEYVANGNLQNYIKEKCRGDEWQVRYGMIKGICHGLHHLHKQRISHLDLKPENVLLDANMKPKITDFGLSRFLPEGQSIVVTQQVFGTRGYIAPELIDSGEISFKTDIYGLGIIITKLLMMDTDYDFENWHESIEVSCPQEKKCVEIAQRCVEYSQDKRPTIYGIIHELNEINNIIQELSPVIIQ